MSAIGSGIAILSSARPNNGPSGDRATYRQDSDFLYLTGCPEPHSVAVFVPQSSNEKSILFLREREPQSELWNGPMLGLSGAHDVLGFDAVYSITELEKKLPKLLAFADTIYWDSTPQQDFHEQLSPLLLGSRLRKHGAEILNVRDVVHELRLFKDEFEIESLRRANAIASEAHEAAMRFSHSGVKEYQVQAVLESVMRSRGSSQLGYPSIVAGGSNACCLHYNVNSCRVENNELLLIDAGCEWNFLTADITRTFPVSGKFTPEQKDIYELTLMAQKAAIEALRPGVLFSQVGELAARVLIDGLLQLGLLSGTAESILESQKHKEFFPHSLGHFLGMDVHDVGRYRIKNIERPLEAGMVVTIEPGLYAQPDCITVDERWRGIGVRIEDNILITRDGFENLTSCVKSVEDVEGTVGQMSPELKSFFGFQSL
jgi:Xaa-Pro aminopeptidase